MSESIRLYSSGNIDTGPAKVLIYFVGGPEIPFPPKKNCFLFYILICM